MDPRTTHYTTNSGCLLDNPQATLKFGDSKLPGVKGQLLLQDINLLETIAHATHERIPERIVHAKGAGAYGVFEVTGDMTKQDMTKQDMPKQDMAKPKITEYTSAKFLSEFGKQTPLFCRFSTVTGGRGSADTVRDTRGFAYKLYTEEGNLDWLFFSEPVFPIRDGGFIYALPEGRSTEQPIQLFGFLGLLQPQF